MTGLDYHMKPSYWFWLKRFLCVRVSPTPRCGGDLPSGPLSADWLQSNGHVHAESRARRARQHFILDAERSARVQQRLQCGVPQRPQRHPSRPQWIPATVRRQPGVPRSGRTRPGWILPLRGQ